MPEPPIPAIMRATMRISELEARAASKDPAMKMLSIDMKVALRAKSL
jgi:hypothetical protein